MSSCGTGPESEVTSMVAACTGSSGYCPLFERFGRAWTTEGVGEGGRRAGINGRGLGEAEIEALWSRPSLQIQKATVRGHR